MRFTPTITYSPSYDIKFVGFEKLHPFDSCKYSHTFYELEKVFAEKINQWLVCPEHPAITNELNTVHPHYYLELLNSSQYIAKALEFPILAGFPNWILDKFILEPMRWATKGTILTAKEALSHGIAINLSGGYHHASRQNGEGFCIYSDIAIAIECLRNEKHLIVGDQVIIIDLDAHQGNGLERIYLTDEDVKIFDMYNEDIYPRDFLAQKRIDFDIPLSTNTNEAEYLALLENNLPYFLEDLRNPKLAIYNAGTDIYEFDPLGGLSVSAQGVLKRDQFVFNTLTNRNIPWMMVLSGGYTYESYKLIAESIIYVMQTWG